MLILLAGLWPGLALALVLGLLVGGVAGRPAGWALPLGLGASVLGLAALAIAGIVPGAPGLWVESGAAMLAVYALGCGLGGLVGVRPGGTPPG